MQVAVVTRVREFVQEVLAEFRKVTWPSRQELINSTVVVIVVTVVLVAVPGRRGHRPGAGGGEDPAMSERNLR